MERETRESGRQPIEDSTITWLRCWKEIEKRGIERESAPWMGDDGNHLARQEEGGQHPKDDCITTMLPSAASEKKWKINDEKQHLWQPQQGEGVGDQM